MKYRDLTSNTPGSEFIYVLKALPTDLLKVDPSYQRKVITARVKSIQAKFVPHAFLPIVVGQRADGTFWIVDGQQRWNAAKDKGWQLIPCLVFRSAGPEHEAQVFSQINHENTRTTSVQNYVSRLRAKDPNIVEIDKCVISCGYTVGSRGGHSLPTIISAVGALEAAYGRGINHLKGVLVFIRDTWPKCHDAIGTMSIGGVSRFMHDNKSKFDYRRLVTCLKPLTPHAAVELARESLPKGDAKRQEIEQARFIGQNRDAAFSVVMKILYDLGPEGVHESIQA